LRLYKSNYNNLGNGGQNMHNNTGYRGENNENNTGNQGKNNKKRSVNIEQWKEFTDFFS